MRREDWIELILRGRGRVELADLLEHCLDDRELRELVRRHGIDAKGFRIDRASSRQLAERLGAAFFENDRLREAVAARLPVTDSADSNPERPGLDERRIAGETLRREEAERQRNRMKQRLMRATRARDTAIRQRENAERKIAELDARIKHLERQLEVLRANEEPAGVDDAEERRASLENEIAASRGRIAELEERDRRNRRRIAELASQVRALEAENRELEALLPRGERERRRRLHRSYQEHAKEGALFPEFAPEFWRSLDGLEREHQRKVFVAIARLLLDGYEHPGLHAKQLKGRDGLWSIRAGDALRVYFEREEGTVRFVHAGTREDQPSFLRKRRDS